MLFRSSQSLKFSVVRKRSNLAWKYGMRAFYYTRGKWIHGPQFKYPAWRFAGMDEQKISPHLYLKWDRDNGTPEPDPSPPRLIAKHSETSLEQLAMVHKTGGNGAAAGSPLRVLGHHN